MPPLNQAYVIWRLFPLLHGNDADETTRFLLILFFDWNDFIDFPFDSEGNFYPFHCVSEYESKIEI